MGVSSRVIIVDVPEQVTRRRRRRDVNFLAKIEKKLHKIINYCCLFFFCFYF